MNQKLREEVRGVIISQKMVADPEEIRMLPKYDKFFEVALCSGVTIEFVEEYVDKIDFILLTKYYLDALDEDDRSAAIDKFADRLNWHHISERLFLYDSTPIKKHINKVCWRNIFHSMIERYEEWRGKENLILEYKPYIDLSKAKEAAKSYWPGLIFNYHYSEYREYENWQLLQSILQIPKEEWEFEGIQAPPEPVKPPEKPKNWFQRLFKNQR